MSAQKDTSQIQEEMTARESSQSAAALNSMIHLDTYASHAQLIMLLPTVTKCAYQDNALESTKFSVHQNNAMHAESARRDQPQITWEEDASDSLLPNAHVTRDSMTQDSDVSDAQLVPDHQWTTEAALMFNATRIKSSEMTCFAHNANGAHQEPSQTHKEETVSSSQDQQSTLMVLQAVTNSQSSTWIELSASSAPTTWRHQLTTWDAWTLALIHLISSNKMVPASHAAMVMFQTPAELDVSSKPELRRAAKEREKSSTQTEPHVPFVTHTPELKDRTLSAFQTNAMLTKSSPG